MHPKDATALYTGGGIWLFYGPCEKENTWYMLSDDGMVLIVDSNPEKAFGKDDDNDCLSLEWQNEHTQKELQGKERLLFNLAVITFLRNYLKENPRNEERLGGIFDNEVDYYFETFLSLDNGFEEAAREAFVLQDWITGTETGGIEAPRIVEKIVPAENGIDIFWRNPETCGLSDCRYHNVDTSTHVDTYRIEEHTLMCNGKPFVDEVQAPEYEAKIESLYKKYALTMPKRD